jgi:hypothetical protein
MEVQAMSFSRSLALGILVLLVSIASLHAQNNRITVSGEVTDASGGVIAGAEVRVTLSKCKCSECEHPEKCDCCPASIAVRSDGAGHYSFTVPHGMYRIDAKAGDREGHIVVDLDSGSSASQDIHVT